MYLYEPGSYAPLARVDQAEGEEQKLYYFHTDQIGTPLELTDSDGEIVWQATYRSWGSIEQLAVTKVAQNFRYQGQYADDETGLHYNTFRYYDPEIGRFNSQDPIGILGSFNFYDYATNPIGWIDPWGLCADKDWGAFYASRTGTRPPVTMERPHAHHIVFKGEFARSPIMQKALERSRAILSKYKIDPVHDTSAMMWAENQGHTIANAKMVAAKLEAADNAILAQDMPFGKAVAAMKGELQKIGAEVFGG
ncbi:hypothetical protein GCM10011247_16110 [Pseudomonas plecoglossicida]|nr:hypothetical protein GCM10011247_16110 [Pseudomonas plecoglossicida]